MFTKNNFFDYNFFMNKVISIIFLFFISFNNSDSWALSPCPSSPPFDNCFGSFTFPSGNTYIGEWQNNKIHGLGTFIFKNGEKYVGENENNYRHGQGTNTYPNGDKYVGEYQNGNKHGQGNYTFANGEKYVGEYKDGKYDGRGTYTWATGDKYIGEYRGGKRHGQGTFVWEDGRKDVGVFKNGKLNGFAISYDKHGNVLREGIWKDDKFLYAKKKSASPNTNSKLEGYKRFCSEIGFTPGTEKFADCVVAAIKKG